MTTEQERDSRGCASACLTSGADPNPSYRTRGERSHRGEVHSMKKNKLIVRVAALATSLAGLLLAGGAGFGVR